MAHEHRGCNRNDALHIKKNGHDDNDIKKYSDVLYYSQPQSEITNHCAEHLVHSIQPNSEEQQGAVGQSLTYRPKTQKRLEQRKPSSVTLQ